MNPKIRLKFTDYYYCTKKQIQVEIEASIFFTVVGQSFVFFFSYIVLQWKKRKLYNNNKSKTTFHYHLNPICMQLSVLTSDFSKSLFLLRSQSHSLMASKESTGNDPPMAHPSQCHSCSCNLNKKKKLLVSQNLIPRSAKMRFYSEFSYPAHPLSFF